MSDPINFIDPDGQRLASPIGGGGIDIPTPITIVIPALIPVATKLPTNAQSQNIKDTGLQHLTDEEVTRLSKDKTIPTHERLGYIKEDKARKN